MDSATPLPDPVLIQALLDAIQEFIVLKDGEGRWLIVNRIVLQAYHLEGVDYLGKTDLELARSSPQFTDAFTYNVHTDEQAWQKGSALMVEKSFIGLDGRLNTWEVVKTPYFDAQGRRERMVIVSRNITERIDAQHARRESERKYRLIAENMSDIIGVFNIDASLKYVSPSLATVLSYQAIDASAAAVMSIVHPDEQAAMRRAFQTLVQRKAVQEKVEGRLRNANGKYLWFEIGYSMVIADDGETLEGVVFACRDITARKEHDELMRLMVNQDPLTGVHNRRYLMDQLQARLGPHAAGRRAFAVLYMDLDRFKSINDSLGHAIGDELLCQVVDRLRQGLRANDLLARIGGDEFVMVLADVDQDQARYIAERLCARLQDSWELSSGALRTTSSVGVALYPRDGDSAHTLLRRADEALYAAKRAGRSQVKFICEVIPA
ncbi:diguanylate cyclase domain-containing protein [Stutzerimonas stutzeri]|uniref:diguanylate cyclase domain-containing protein n=1 Tax=Stutzerimonas stutzeri TaxID=316 RepID=UPI00210A8FC7|nr:diguanylate cyclase [Stutzerimonas stutzeri]